MLVLSSWGSGGRRTVVLSSESSDCDSLLDSTSDSFPSPSVSVSCSDDDGNWGRASEGWLEGIATMWFADCLPAEEGVTR